LQYINNIKESKQPDQGDHYEHTSTNITT